MLIVKFDSFQKNWESNLTKAKIENDVTTRRKFSSGWHDEIWKYTTDSLDDNFGIIS